jgi:hypothetical protein
MKNRTFRDRVVASIEILEKKESLTWEERESLEAMRMRLADFDRLGLWG